MGAGYLVSHNAYPFTYICCFSSLSITSSTINTQVVLLMECIVWLQEISFAHVLALLNSTSSVKRVAAASRNDHQWYCTYKRSPLILPTTLKHATCFRRFPLPTTSAHILSFVFRPPWGSIYVGSIYPSIYLKRSAIILAEDCARVKPDLKKLTK